MAAGGDDLTAWVVLGALLVPIAIIDLATHRIPNALNAVLLLAGLGVSAITDVPTVLDAVLGCLLGAALLLVIAVGFRRLRGHDGLGLGDVKFLAAAGAWVGWIGIGPLVFLAATCALLVLGARRLAGAPTDRRTPVALGPYLCVALIVVRALRNAGTMP